MSLADQREMETECASYKNARLFIFAGKKKSVREIVSANHSVLTEADWLGRSLLIYAVICRSYDIAKYLVKRGADVNLADRYGRTSLHWASLKGGYNCVKLLLSNGADPLVTDAEGATPIHLSVCVPSPDCLALLLAGLEHSRSTDTIPDDAEHRSPLHWACTLGHISHVSMLLKQASQKIDQRDIHGRSVLFGALKSKSSSAEDIARLLLKDAPWVINQQDIDGYSPLHVTSASNNLMMTLLLLEYDKCNVNSLDNEFRTPLHWSACLGFTDIAKVLLMKGAKLIRDRSGATPLHYAALNDDVVGVKALIDGAKLSEDLIDISGRSALMWAAVAGADGVINFLLQRFPSTDVNCRDRNGSTALHLAAMADRPTTAELLLKRDWFLESVDNASRTPLMVAAEYGKSACCQVFLSAGANLFAKDLKGRTALHWASLGGHSSVCSLLAARGVSPDVADFGGRTPLHCAAFGGFVDCISALVKEDGDVDIADNEGFTPLHFSAQQGHLQAVRFLVQYDAPINAMTYKSDCATPLDLAKAKDHAAVVEYLESSGALKFTDLREVAACKIQRWFRWYRWRQRVNQKCAGNW